jgi:glucose/arabinose dehydrogenase
VLALIGCLLAGGCAERIYVVPIQSRHVIDRRITEYPDGYELKTFMTGLTCPTAICFDDATGDLFVAEGGIDGRDPKIIAIKPDGAIIRVYPTGTRIPIFQPGFHIYGPIGGMVAYKGKIYVSHRDSRDMGMITEFDLDGSHKTIVAELPAQGDYGVTDLAIPPSPFEPRLYFGVGSATNSGVVGLDNWQAGWVRKHRDACDLSFQALYLLGFRFDVANPEASIFTPSSLVTVPFEPLGTSNVVQIPAVQFPVQKPSGVIESVALDGGGIRIEAFGVRNPAGIAVDSFGTTYLTDQGMELRGTRPIDNDPDGLYWLTSPGPTQWLGWPDYSRSLESVDLPKYQPPTWMVIPSGYPYVGPVINHEKSKLTPPNPDSLIRGLFPPQSGAGKMAFFPNSGPFHSARFDGQLLVALWGDRAPFSTSGRPIAGQLPGYRVDRVDLTTGHISQISPFIYNTRGGPASKLSEGGSEGIERPVDVKFGPDGNLYVLDFGQAVFKHGHLKVTGGTGKIFILQPIAASATTTTTR